MRPAVTDYVAFYGTYIDLVPEPDILPAMHDQLAEVMDFLRGVPEAEGDVCHPPYTWTVKEVVGHLTDGERVFGYRALRFGRGDATPLAGFDEQPYVRSAEYARLSLADVVSEYEAARRSNLWLFRNLPGAAWDRAGVASDNRVTVRALAYIVAGHTRHHTAILRKRLGG